MTVQGAKWLRDIAVYFQKRRTGEAEAMGRLLRCLNIMNHLRSDVICSDDTGGLGYDYGNKKAVFARDDAAGF